MHLRMSWENSFLLPGAESIKTELQHTGGVKHSTDEEGSTTDKIKEVHTKRLPLKIRQRSRSTQQKMELQQPYATLTNSRHLDRLFLQLYTLAGNQMDRCQG